MSLEIEKTGWGGSVFFFSGGEDRILCFGCLEVWTLPGDTGIGNIYLKLSNMKI